MWSGHRTSKLVRVKYGTSISKSVLRAHSGAAGSMPSPSCPRHPACAQVLLQRVLSVLVITAERFSLLLGIGRCRKTTVSELKARVRVDAITLRRSVTSLGRSSVVRNFGGWGRAAKHLALIDQDRRLMNEALDAWECACIRWAEAHGEEALRIVGSGMSQPAAAAEAAVSTAGFEKSCHAAE